MTSAPGLTKPDTPLHVMFVCSGGEDLDTFGVYMSIETLRPSDEHPNRPASVIKDGITAQFVANLGDKG